MQEQAPISATATATANADGTNTNKDYRNSHHSRRGVLPQRTASGGSNNAGGGSAPAVVVPRSSPALPTPQRASNRGSANSLWSSLMHNGRRIYGSTASVASSITCTEFNEDYSQELLNFSEHSLDIRHLHAEEDELDAANVDSKPTIPQRQISVTAGQSSGLLSTSDHTRLSGLTKIDEGQQQQQQQQEEEESLAMPPPPPPPMGGPFRASGNTTTTTSTDMSPKQPGRKTSITDASLRDSTCSRSSTASSTISTNNKDSLPSYPSRKKSSKIVSGGIILEEGEDEFGSEKS